MVKRRRPQTLTLSKCGGQRPEGAFHWQGLTCRASLTNTRLPRVLVELANQGRNYSGSLSATVKEPNLVYHKLKGEPKLPLVSLPFFFPSVGS